MSRHPVRTAVLGVLLSAGLVTSVGGCADPSDDPRATASREGMRYCPAPNEPPLAPQTPCISQDPAQKYAENHGYRRQTAITEEQRAGARGRAEDLAEALRGLTGRPVGASEVRAAAAVALGLEPGDIEYRAGADGKGKGLQNIDVGGGEGRVCVNGRIDDQGRVTAEVAGRTLDGTCLPGLGGH
ncbi:precorrin-3B C(17)-methyltransferase [Streptomyces sp. NBC_00691]|uniref:precorrin-3B C(17)-methyltransferase n=1 Tax=Streptomyces sp. NBC_00691 TaxID=2903671 RepID=UPI002E35A92B|nr:precorrin-3B C(17)-methyltransferase [Streptomyces sp. NBC_00691]